MFVLSVKTSRRRVLSMALAGLLLLAALFAFVGGQGSTPAATNAVTDGVSHLQSLGYEVDPQWISLREVVIPLEFDTAFAAYNEMQTEAGYDLTPYKGRRVKCRTYTVLNYPGTEGVQATVYEYGGRIIGGDLSSATGGVSHGLTPLTPTAVQDKGETNGTTG